MTLINELYSFNFFLNLPPYLAHLMALLSSVLAGAVLGVEREKKGKTAGVRTFALVCFGSCLFVLIGAEVSEGRDQGRIISQLISGIGFLGAGAVIRDGSRNSGMTTAAGIWVCAGLGVVFGLGYFPFGALVTLTVYGVFKLNRSVEVLMEGPCQIGRACVIVNDPSARAQQQVRAILENSPGVTWEFKEKANETRFDISVCENHPRHRRCLVELAAIEQLRFVK